MTDRSGARRVLVTGPAGVGKSTICRLVAEGLPRSTAIDADVVRESIVSGFVEPEFPDFSEAAIEQMRLQREIVNDWIDRMVAAGYHAIIDDAPIPPKPHFHSDYAALLADPTSIPVVLMASKEAVRARLGARAGPFDDWFLDNLDDMLDNMREMLRDPAWADWIVIDTSALTPQDVAALILGRL